LVLFASLNQPLQAAVRHYAARLSVRLSWFSIDNPFWELTRGLFLSCYDSYTATHLLVSDDRPRPYPAQAAQVARSTLEALAAVMVLMERPSRVHLYWLDEYRERRLQYDRLSTGEYARIPQWAEWLQHVLLPRIDNLAVRLRHFGALTVAMEEKPSTIRTWPRPPKVADGKDSEGQPFLTGNRREAWLAIYDLWYAEQSRVAHQLADSVNIALGFRRPQPAESIQELRTDVVVPAGLCLACVMSEIEVVSLWPQRAPASLYDAWVAQCTLSPPIQGIFDRRYRDLLK
jgi:hypothetical protein